VCGGRNSRSDTEASLWTNSELSLEENVLSKWCEQGALYNESAGSIIHSEIDRKRYEINITGKTI
jgi:hypothetical protein